MKAFSLLKIIEKCQFILGLFFFFPSLLLQAEIPLEKLSDLSLLNIQDLESENPLELLNPVYGATLVHSQTLKNWAQFSLKSPLTDFLNELYQDHDQEFIPSTIGTRMPSYLHPKLIGMILAHGIKNRLLIKEKSELISKFVSESAGGAGVKKKRQTPTEDERKRLRTLKGLNSNGFVKLFFEDSLVQKKIQENRLSVLANLDEEQKARVKLLELIPSDEEKVFSLTEGAMSKNAPKEKLMSEIDLKKDKGALFCLGQAFKLLADKYEDFRSSEAYLLWKGAAYNLKRSTPDNQALYSIKDFSRNPKGLERNIKYIFNSFVNNLSKSDESYGVFLSLLWLMCEEKSDYIPYYEGIREVLGDEAFSEKGLAILDNKSDEQAQWVDLAFDPILGVTPYPDLNDLAERTFWTLDTQVGRATSVITWWHANVGFGKTYPDCGATSLRNFINKIMLINGKPSIEVLAGLNPKKEILDFFANLPVNSRSARNIWGRLVSDHGPEVKYKHSFQLSADETIECEVSGGYDNMIALINKIFFDGENESKVKDFRELSKRVTAARAKISPECSEVQISPFKENSSLTSARFLVRIGNSERYMWRFNKGHFSFDPQPCRKLASFPVRESYKGNSVAAKRARASLSVWPSSQEKFDMLLRIWLDKTNSLPSSVYSSVYKGLQFSKLFGLEVDPIIFSSRLESRDCVDYFKTFAPYMRSFIERKKLFIQLVRKLENDPFLFDSLFDEAKKYFKDEDLDEELLRVILPFDGMFLSKAPVALRSRLDLFKIAFKQNFKVAQFASNDLKESEEFIQFLLNEDHSFYRYLSDSTRSSREDILEMVLQSDPALFFHTLAPLSQDVFFAKQVMLSLSESLYDKLDPDLRDNEDMLDFIFENDLSLSFASERLKSNEIYVKKFVEKDPWQIRFASRYFIEEHRAYTVFKFSEAVSFQYNEVGPDSKLENLFEFFPENLKKDEDFLFEIYEETTKKFTLENKFMFAIFLDKNADFYQKFPSFVTSNPVFFLRCLELNPGSKSPCHLDIFKNNLVNYLDDMKNFNTFIESAISSLKLGEGGDEEGKHKTLWKIVDFLSSFSYRRFSYTYRGVFYNNDSSFFKQPDYFNHYLMKNPSLLQKLYFFEFEKDVEGSKELEKDVEGSKELEKDSEGRKIILFSKEEAMVRFLFKNAKDGSVLFREENSRNLELRKKVFEKWLNKNKEIIKIPGSELIPSDASFGKNYLQLLNIKLSKAADSSPDACCIL